MKPIDEGDLERASLMPDRWYVILRKVDEESFAIAAYDTTAEEDEEFYEAGTVVINGIMELVESDFERVLSAGMARLTFDQVKEDMVKEKDGPSVQYEEGTNIVKIDFGKVQ